MSNKYNLCGYKSKSTFALTHFGPFLSANMLPDCLLSQLQTEVKNSKRKSKVKNHNKS